MLYKLYTQTSIKNTDIFISFSFEQKMSAPASDGKPK